MKRRDVVRMSDAEVDAFLHERHTMSCASIAPTGRIHLVAMWYGFVGGDLAMWSFRKAQKVLNVQRDPRATWMVEDGDDYAELRGVELAGTVEIVDDPEYVKELGWSLQERYLGITRPADTGGGVERFLEDQATKRVALRMRREHVASWDHRKLGGTY
ncbi:MAG TPA: pyridoxamine 5'-phosphate oxidase family protein [Acidimicrobiales bacterium]|nr:pyridoxamine 5'-phosphate oxidase family protein [Acidimicrobiales bacterium]